MKSTLVIQNVNETNVHVTLHKLQSLKQTSLIRSVMNNGVAVLTGQTSMDVFSNSDIWPFYGVAVLSG